MEPHSRTEIVVNGFPGRGPEIRRDRQDAVGADVLRMARWSGERVLDRERVLTWMVTGMRPATVLTAASANSLRSAMVRC